MDIQQAAELASIPPPTDPEQANIESAGVRAMREFVGSCTLF